MGEEFQHGLLKYECAHLLRHLRLGLNLLLILRCGCQCRAPIRFQIPLDQSSGGWTDVTDVFIREQAQKGGAYFGSLVRVCSKLSVRHERMQNP